MLQGSQPPLLLFWQPLQKIQNLPAVTLISRLAKTFEPAGPLENRENFHQLLTKPPFPANSIAKAHMLLDTSGLVAAIVIVSSALSFTILVPVLPSVPPFVIELRAPSN